jgi:hypothetical protein
MTALLRSITDGRIRAGLRAEAKCEESQTVQT